MQPVLYIVIPCYNEQEVLPVTAPAFSQKLTDLYIDGKISEHSRILFVDDGSRDDTWKIITELSQIDEHCCGISLSRNRGHQNALLAGLMEVKDKCDICISADCDGQDDIDAIDKMVDEYLAGSEVVYGVRSDRKRDTIFKRLTAQAFYRLMKSMGADIVYNHADYRLLSRRALQSLAEFREVNLFLRGLVPMIGFRCSYVEYSRKERVAGKSKYPLKKMLSFAIDGITSLSVKPIRLITSFGFAVSLFSIIGIIWSVVTRFVYGPTGGWASTISIMCFLGGVQLLSLGVIGEYIGKIYLEVKQRPRYIVDKKTEDMQ